ncbi:glucan endo-1,3-beta-glucosidase 6-like [Cocos nucifera]|uniref:Glucan endo-1,3-beta-glucosidase 6-like n=1 Tax=Cocos nucifera TaxID=13894 RepID=A0A8K0IR01_COCNU|nr:glucan endo-1,3-beta-glucosidase 6-like [Cocos nucifera]
MAAERGWWVSPVLGVICWLCLVVSVSGIGANWGMQTSHPLPPSVVVRMLRENGFQKVKLFDADEETMNALKKSGLEVMVGIPNDMLAMLATSVKAAEQWVNANVSDYINGGVKISQSHLYGTEFGDFAYAPDHDPPSHEHHH